MKSLTSKITLPLAALALVVSAGGAYVTAAHADTTTAPTTQSSTTHVPPAAVGTVTAVTGDTITLTDTKSNTTYTIDATNATIDKMTPPTTTSGTTDTTGTPPARPTPTVISVSGISVGDTLRVQGTVSGTNITATKIVDGRFMGGRGGHGGPGGMGVQGTVTAVNGSTVTVQGQNGTTYTIDDSGATASKVTTMSPSDISVGDTIGVQGTVSGTTVTAKNIMDGITLHAAPSATTGTSAS